MNSDVMGFVPERNVVILIFNIMTIVTISDATLLAFCVIVAVLKPIKIANLMNAYNENVKNKARQAVIDNAIKALTTSRASSTLARRSYVRDVWEHFVKGENYFDAHVARKLSEETIVRWESFYDSIAQSKKSENLKVAYLSGPNPENDLRVLCEAGVLPENIWAFESENKVYSEAVVSALNSEFPYIKIINGGLDSFVEASPQRFDIIYLDFCSPLPSRGKSQKTLTAITRILAKHSLNSPGVLITNFSLPTEAQDSVGRAMLAKLVACYLYPKEFLEASELDNSIDEGAIANGYEYSQWHQLVSANLDFYYGQFVTRLLMDHASVISPYNRFPKQNAIFKKFFNINNKELLKKNLDSLFHFSEDDGEDYHGGGNVIVDPGQDPILWTLAALDKDTNKRDLNYPQFIFEDNDFSIFADNFIAQLDVSSEKKELVSSIKLLSYLLSEGSGNEEFLSDRLKDMYKNHSFRSFHQFCDLVLVHQSMEALFRQVATPYQVNVEKSLRWSYQAKDTPMFMDMLILDECRYLYDWMPTADMFSEAIRDIERQLAYRFALDGVAKHRRWYNPEFFFGTAVVDQYTEGFYAKTLLRREIIRDDI